MTLNQVIQRIASLAKSHRQVNTFAVGDVLELMAQTGIVYPAVNVDVNNGVVDWSQKQTFIPVTVHVLDLINVADNTRTNEMEVFSDTLSIAEDIYAMIADYQLQDDWTIAETLSFQFVREKFDDMVGGVTFTLEISKDYLKDTCQVPKL